ncbi:hypothetical protein OG828_48525 [Streptomyces sp. NBC_00457]|uniref:hypothetical protein n=1 Tax=Streptomyces sp. NBC_00457 TaxID=2975748 RepID=UPI002E1F5695
MKPATLSFVALRSRGSGLAASMTKLGEGADHRDRRCHDRSLDRGDRGRRRGAAAPGGCLVLWMGLATKRRSLEEITGELLATDAAWPAHRKPVAERPDV